MKIKQLLSTMIVVCVIWTNSLLTPTIFAQSGGTFQIEKSVIAGGGATSTGGTFTLEGTIGQSVAGTTSTGGTFGLQSGFWADGSAPAAVEVSVSGRVTTPAGQGLRNAIVTITDQQGIPRSVLTSSFGFYTFENVLTGQTYVIRVSSKRFRFQSQVVEVDGSLANVNFVGLE